MLDIGLERAQLARSHLISDFEAYFWFKQAISIESCYLPWKVSGHFFSDSRTEAYLCARGSRTRSALGI